MQTLYSRSVRQQDAIHTLKKCFVIKNPTYGSVLDEISHVGHTLSLNVVMWHRHKACVRPRTIQAVILIFVHVRPLAEDVILILLGRLFTPGLHIAMWRCLELTQVTITCAGKDSLRGNYFIHQMQLLLGRMRVHVTFQIQIIFAFKIHASGLVNVFIRM